MKRAHQTMTIDAPITFGEDTGAFKQPPLVPQADPELIGLLRSAHGVPFFICAPRKTGRTSLMLDYAQRQHRLDDVLWIDAASEGFCRAIGTDAVMEHLERQWVKGPVSYRLVVFDDLPLLGDRVASRFSDWIDRMVEEEIEVAVITTPHEDCLSDYQSDRLLIAGDRLVASQRWGAARMAETLECFFSAPIPCELTTLAALMILMGRGIMDNLRDLGYQIPTTSYALLKQYCPLLAIDELTGHFDTTGLPVARLASRLLTLLNEASRTEREPEMSETERCFERLTQLSVHLFERSEREQSLLLLELAGKLLTHDDAGYPLDAANSSASAVQPASALEDSDTLFAELVADITLAEKDGASFEPVGEDDVWAQLTGGGSLAGACKNPNAPRIIWGATEEEPAELVIKLFGYLEIFKGGRLLEAKDLQRRRVRALLIHLVLNRGCGIARDTLMERLWPDKSLARAKDNFYATWSRLSRILNEGNSSGPYIINSRGLCRLESALVTTDIHEFEQLSKAILLEQGTIEQRVEAIYRLEQLYRGDILSGCGVDTFVQNAQMRYRAVLVDVMLEASRLFSRQDNDTNAVWFARKAYDTDPSREDVYRVLMAVQDKAGQRTSALRTYFDCKRFLSEELGILPSQKTTALYQELILDRR
jgi:DNA-binding SARP family transcriptional activator